MRALIIGAGAQGRVTLDILRAQARHDRIDFIDEDERLWGSQVNGSQVIGNLQEALGQSVSGVEVIVALGHPRARLAVAERVRERHIPFLNAVHPSAVVMPSVKMGSGNMIGATAVVNTDSQVGDHTIINTGAVIEHDCLVAHGATIGPGAHLGARSSMGTGAFLGTGAIVLSRVAIGEEAVLAAGAVLTHDLPQRVLAMGVPARIREQIDEGFDWGRLL